MKSYFKSFVSLFKYLDLFQQTVSLKIKKKYRVSLVVGRLLSIGIIIFLIYNAVNSDMVQRINPITLQQNERRTSRPEVNLTSDNFLLVFSVSDDFFYIPPDPTIYYYQLIEYSLIDGVVVSAISHEFEPCNETFFSDFPGAFDNLTFRNMSCLKKTNFSVKGYWDEKELKYFSVKIFKCVNDTKLSACKSEEEIDEFFKIKYFNTLTIERSFDLTNYENPISSKIKSFFTGLELGRRKTVSNFLKQTKILTDRSAMFNEYDEIWTTVFEQGDIDSQRADDCLIEYILYSSEYLIVFQRRYQKLFELLASLGGILSPLLIIGSVFVKLINEWNVNEIIMNKIYTVDFKGFPEKKKKTLHFQERKNKTLRKKSFHSRNGLKLSFFEKILFAMKNKKNYTPKEAVYNSYLKKSNIKLDLFEILKKLEEIHRLKYILLSKKQLELFNAFSKQVLFSHNDFLNSALSRYTLDFKNINASQKKRLLEMVEKLKQHQSPSEIDKRLLVLIEGNKSR